MHLSDGVTSRDLLIRVHIFDMCNYKKVSKGNLYSICHSDFIRQTLPIFKYLTLNHFCNLKNSHKIKTSFERSSDWKIIFSINLLIY